MCSSFNIKNTPLALADAIPQQLAREVNDAAPIRGFCGLTCGLPHCAERVVAVRGADNCDDATAKLSCGECEQGWEFERGG
eukprot:s232_g9.t3